MRAHPSRIRRAIIAPSFSVPLVPVAHSPTEPLYFRILKNYPTIHRYILTRPLEQSWFARLWRREK